MTSEKLDQVNEGVRRHGVAYLTDLAENDPAFFLELVAYAIEPQQRAAHPERLIGPVEFVYTRQPGSHNRT